MQILSSINLSKRGGRVSSYARESLTVFGPQVTKYSDNSRWSIQGRRETFVLMSSIVSMKTISSVSSFSAITVYKGTHNKNNKLCNSLSTERDILHLHVLLECYNILFLPQGKCNIKKTLFVKNGLILFFSETTELFECRRGLCATLHIT